MFEEETAEEDSANVSAPESAPPKVSGAEEENRNLESKKESEDFEGNLCIVENDEGHTNEFVGTSSCLIVRRKKVLLVL